MLECDQEGPIKFEEFLDTRYVKVLFTNVFNSVVSNSYYAMPGAGGGHPFVSFKTVHVEVKWQVSKKVYYRLKTCTFCIVISRAHY